MPFVKLDCGMLDSSIWFEREQRELFITALLMAEPHYCETAQEQLHVDSLEKTGFVAPAGPYGFVAAAGSGIIHRAGVERDKGFVALAQLGEPDKDSRSKEYEGRRLIRVDGGFLILNYFKYRDYDRTGAERQKRHRDNKKLRNVTRDSNGVTRDKRNEVTHAEAEAEAEAEADKNTTELIHQGSGGNGQDETTVPEVREVRKVRRPKSVEEFIAGAAAIGIPEQDLRDQYALWDVADWHNGFGTPIYDWKRALVSLKQKNLLPSQVRREPELRTGETSPAAFQPSREWIIEHFRAKTRGMNYMPVARYCHEKLVARGFIWHRQPLRDEEHARAVLSDIAEEYSKKA